jgi:Ca2+-binding RTX toxin-like protein
VPYSLPAHVENLLLTGLLAIDGTGNELDNVITGNSANNIIAGAAGNDTLVASDGFDVLDGGANIDTVDFTDFSSAVWVNLGYSGVEAWTTDRTNIASGTWRSVADLESVENLIGTAYADELYGNGADNVLSYTGGADRLDGAGGVDTADFSRFGSAVWVNLSHAQAEAWTTDRSSIASGAWRAIADLQSIENLTGTAFADELYGDAGNNVLNYTGGVDRLDGARGVDTADFSHFGSAVWVNLGYGQAEAWTTDRSSIASGTWRAIATCKT